MIAKPALFKAMRKQSSRGRACPPQLQRGWETAILTALALGFASPAQAEFFLNASTTDAAPAYEAGPNTYSRQRESDTTINVGRQGTSGAFHQAAVFPFQLPNFGAVAAPFSNAEFIFRLGGKDSVSGFDLDLYGLPSRTSSAVLPSSASTTNRGDFFMGGFLSGPTDDNASGVVKLQDNIATAATSDGLVQTNLNGGTQLAAYLNAQYNNGTGAGRWVFLRLSTDAVPSGAFRYNISTADQSTAEYRPRIRYNFTPELYTRIGTDLTFQQLVDNGTIVPGVDSSPGPVYGSTIDVNNSLLQQQTGVTGPIAQDIRIHTQVNSSVLRSNFPNFTRWYQEDGNVQVMRLFQGDQNVRSGIGAEGTPGRIEAFFTPFAVALGTWAVWEATYTVIDPLQANIFQLFHEGGQLWAFHLRMTSAGNITFNRRSEIAGLPTNLTLATDMVGKSISFRVRAKPARASPRMACCLSAASTAAPNPRPTTIRRPPRRRRSLITGTTTARPPDSAPPAASGASPPPAAPPRAGAPAQAGQPFPPMSPPTPPTRFSSAPTQTGSLPAPSRFQTP
jgi:hypothetical protein